MKNTNMEILIIIFALGGTIGLFLLLFFFLDGLLMVEPLEKLEYISEMGTVLAPCVVMTNDTFGEPYTFKTWGITIALMLGCLVLSMFISCCIEWIEGNADRRQIKRQKKNKQKVVKKLIGRNVRKIN